MPSHSRLLSLFLGAGILAACAAAPDYRPPEVPVAPGFLGGDGIAHRQFQSKAELQAWWVSFDDPLLTRFVSAAVEQNLDLSLIHI